MSYLKCLDYCGYTPGLEIPFADSTLNWLGESTPDQKRIEDVLWSMVKSDATILHVGIGNSSLAIRFYPFVNTVHGVTIGQRERNYAASLALPHYQTWRVNKYHSRLLDALEWVPYSFIIDNNLGSYCCCQRHFHCLMNNYALMLKNGGMILTDKAGLAHAPGDPNWDLTDDIQGIADRFGLTLTAETDMVYGLRK